MSEGLNSRFLYTVTISEEKEKEEEEEKEEEKKKQEDLTQALRVTILLQTTAPHLLAECVFAWQSEHNYEIKIMDPCFAPAVVASGYCIAFRRAQRGATFISRKCKYTILEQGR